MGRTNAKSGGWAATIVTMLALAAFAISGCGSGGGDSNGGLCEQCGQSDGPCQSSVSVSGADAQALCDGQASCDVALACLRELGSAQRRCYPADARFDQFECDGARANRSIPTPTKSPTPTLTRTATPTSSGPTATGGTPTASGPTPTPAPTATPVCGNNVVEGDEQCDGTDLDLEDCGSFCDDDGGTLRCTPQCTFDFSLCTNPPCEL